MARLITTGFDVQIIATSEATTAEGELQSYPAATPPAFSTVTKHGTLGNSSLACNAVNEFSTWTITFSTTVNYYIRVYVRMSAIPANQSPIIQVLSRWSLRWETNGALRLYDASNAAVGTGSAVLSIDTWYEVMVRAKIPTSGNGELEFRLDKAVIDNITPAIGTAAGASLRVGCMSSVAPGATFYFDDLAVNSDSGSAPFNTWPETGYCMLLRPVSDNAIGGSWQAPQTTGADVTNIYDAVDNAIPAGVAHSDTDANNLKYVFDAVSEDASYDVNIMDYATAGIPAEAVIRIVQGMVRVGTSSLTSTNDGVARLVSNPADGADTTISFEGAGATAGTEPVGWRTYRTEQQLTPSVTRGTQPVLRVRKTTLATRAHMCDFMAVLVEYKPVTVVAIGQASEQNTYQAVVARKSLTVGLPAESDSSLALATEIIVEVGQPAETDSTQAVTAKKSVTVGEPEESDATFAVTVKKTLALGQPAESDAIFAVTTLKTLAVGQPVEEDSPQAVAGLKSLAVGMPAETDTAFAFDENPMRRLIAQALESDAVQAVTSRKDLAIGQPAEADSSQAITGRKTLVVGQPAETDSPQGVVARKTLAFVQVVEQDAAQAMTARKALVIGQPTETDAAQPVDENPMARLIGQALEQDATQAVSVKKSVTVGQPAEEDTPLAVTARKTLALSLVAESDAAQVATPEKSVVVGLPAEGDTPQAVTARKTLAVGQPPEDDSAFPIAGAVPQIDPVYEENAAQPVVVRKTLTVSQPAENGSTQVVTAGKVVSIAVPEETGVAQVVAPSKLAVIVPAEEVDATSDVTRVKTGHVVMAVEDDSVFDVIGEGQVVAIGPSLEANEATDVYRIKRIILVQANEENISTSVLALKFVFYRNNNFRARFVSSLVGPVARLVDGYSGPVARFVSYYSGPEATSV